MPRSRTIKLDARPRGFVVTVPIFNVDVAVLVNMTSTQALKHARRRYNARALADFERNLDRETWDLDGTRGRAMGVANGFAVLLHVGGDDFAYDTSIVVHECQHVVQWLLRNRDTPLSEDTEEIYCYLLDYLVKQVIERLWR